MRPRAVGCVTMVVGLSLVASGLTLLLLLVASSWGGGFSPPVQTILLVGGLGLGFAGIVVGLTGAEVVLSRRRP